MNEIDFLRGIEGDKQQGADLISGAEHLVRLKIQTGYSQEQYPDLELEKQASAGRFAVGATLGGAAGAMGGEKKDRARNALGGSFMGSILAMPGMKAKDLSNIKHLKKQAGELTESLNTPPVKCKDCGKVKTACMCSTKTASANILKQALKEKLAEPNWNKLMLGATTGLGAIAGGVGTYLASRPQKETGKSKSEEELESMVASQKDKPENGLLHKLKNREVENAHGFSKAFREHPVKASLIGAGMGALAGRSIGQLAGAIGKRGVK